MDRATGWLMNCLMDRLILHVTDQVMDCLIANKWIVQWINQWTVQCTSWWMNDLMDCLVNCPLVCLVDWMITRQVEWLMNEWSDGLSGELSTGLSRGLNDGMSSGMTDGWCDDGLAACILETLTCWHDNLLGGHGAGGGCAWRGGAGWWCWQRCHHGDQGCRRWACYWAARLWITKYFHNHLKALQVHFNDVSYHLHGVHPVCVCVCVCVCACVCICVCVYACVSACVLVCCFLTMLNHILDGGHVFPFSLVNEPRDKFAPD